MRWILLAAMLALAGCSDGGDGDVGPGGGGGEPGGNETYGVPDAMSESGTVPLGVQWDCVQPCPSYAFTLEGNTTVHAVLSWTVPANDVDLFIYDEDNGIVAEGIAGAPQTMEEITQVLGAGDYTIAVVPYRAVPGDTFTLDVDFAVA